MHPINKEYLTPSELRRDADTLERSAKRLQDLGVVGGARDALARAFGKRTTADMLEQAALLRDEAEYLEDVRAPRPPATTGNPYGEVVPA